MTDMIRVTSEDGHKVEVTYQGVALPHVKNVEWDSDWAGSGGKLVVEFDHAEIDIAVPVGKTEARARDGTKFGMGRLLDILGRSQ